MKCAHCAVENKDTAKFCGKCGQSLAASSPKSETTKPCPDCGAACKAEAKFCPKCGRNFSAASILEAPVMTSAEVPPANAVDLESVPCAQCGAALKSGAKFCGKCGTSVVDAKQEEVQPTPVVAEAAPELAMEATQLLTTAPLAEEQSSNQASLDATMIAPPEPATPNVAPETVPCLQCGADLKLGAKFCGKCGVSMVETKLEPVQAEPVVAEPIPVAAMVAATESPSLPSVEASPSPGVGEETLNGPLHELLAKHAPQSSPDAQIQAPVPAPEPIKIAPKVPTSEPQQKPRKMPMAPIAAGAAALVIMVGAGGYFVMKEKSSSEAKEAAADKPVMQASAAPTPPSKPEELSPPNLNQGAPRPPAAPVVPETSAAPAPVAVASAPPAVADKPKPAPAPKAVAPAQNNALQAAIDASMEEGDKCMGRKKYDCAISSANTVLRLDPSNARAQEMKRKAKEAQDRALSQIDIQ